MKKKNLWVGLSLIFLSTLTVIAFIPIFTYLIFAKDLQTRDSIMNRNNTGLVLLDRKDRPFFTFYEAKYKKFVPLSKIPKHTRLAIIASEDKEFYRHPGFSIRGMVRSMILDLKEKDVHYGGSTITQQLVKNSFLNTKKSFVRKYQEVVLAQEIERRFSKDEILEMYLNSVYFGEGAFGIEQAARTYFAKSASDLTVAESALLVGILPAPSQYSPLSGNEEAAKKRQEYVLSAMQSAGYITEKQAQSAEKSTLTYSKASEDINTTAIHFALMVRDQLVRKYGEEQISRSGYKVKTTLDLDWQKYAEKAVADQVEKLAPNNVSNGSAVVIDPKTGEVLVLVGSSDWYDGKFGKVNVATSDRSPGSAFKPIIYAAALEKRLITAATPLQDRPTTFQKTYSPQNYDRKFRGTVLVRRALANSLNVPAVAVLEKLGVPAGVEMARRMGLTTVKDPSNYGLSLVLGTAEVKLLEMTNAYAIFADNGTKHDITSVLAITDKHDGVVYEHQTTGTQVVDPGVAFIISSILSDNAARQEVFGNTLTVSRPAAVKTGTAESYKDALTIGYTPELAVGVWVGNNDSEPMDQIAGSLGAAPIWRSLIERFSQGRPIARFAPPGDITQRSVCSNNGLLVRTTFAKSGGREEYFLSGTEPTRYCFIPRPTRQPMERPLEEFLQTREKENNEEKEKDKKEKKNDNGRGGPEVEQFEQAQKQVEEKIQRELEEQVQQQIQQLQDLQQPTPQQFPTVSPEQQQPTP